MDAFGLTRDMPVAAVSPIDKTPLIESRRQIRYPKVRRLNLYLLCLRETRFKLNLKKCGFWNGVPYHSRQMGQTRQCTTRDTNINVCVC